MTFEVQGVAASRALLTFWMFSTPVVFEPVAEGFGALLGVDGDAVFPGGAAAEDAVEGDAGFAGELEGFDEDGVGDAGREVDEGQLVVSAAERGRARGLRRGCRRLRP